MKKCKWFAMILAAAMVVCLLGTSLSVSAEETEPGEVKVLDAANSTLLADVIDTSYEPGIKMIGATVANLAEPWVEGFLTSLGKKYEEYGVKVQALSCDANSVTQVEQVENFITMGVDQIIIIPFQPGVLFDPCDKAIAAGIDVIWITNVTDDVKEHISAGMAADAYQYGVEIAKLALSWVDEKYGKDAPEGSVHCGTLTNIGIEYIANRTQGILDTLGADPRIALTYDNDGCMFTDDSIAATEDMLTVDPEIRLIVCWSDTHGIPADSVLKSKNVDLSEYCIVAGCTSDATCASIDASANNESAFRGTIVEGKIDFADDLFAVSYGLATGQIEKPYYSLHELSYYTTIKDIDPSYKNWYEGK